MHESASRLYQAAVDAGKIAGLAPLTELARALNASVQKVKNWEKRGVSKEGALMAQNVLGISATWVLEGVGPVVSGALASPPEAAASARDATNQIAVWNEPADLPEDSDRVWIDRYDYACSAGNGIVQWEIRQKRALPFTGDFFRAIGSKPENCRLATARGSSMEPFLFDRDMIMIDVSRTAVRDGNVYAVCFEDESLVKQLFKLPGGALQLHSYNPKFPDRVISPADGASFHVVGEIVYRSGSGWTGA